MSNQNMDTSAMNESTPSIHGRRNVLRLGALGVGAAVLSACGSGSDPIAGISGDTVPTTDVPPSPPTTLPTAAQLENDLVQLRTASSLELLAADAYEEYGPLLADSELTAASARFAADHRANAEIFQDALAAKDDTDDRANQANEVIQTTRIDPIVSSLTSEGENGDGARLGVFRDIERMLAATYINASGVFTEAEWRSRISTHAAAAARRVTVLDGGNAPGAALFPGSELIPNNAFLGEALETEGTGTEGDDAAEAEGGSDDGAEGGTESDSAGGAS